MAIGTAIFLRCSFPFAIINRGFLDTSQRFIYVSVTQRLFTKDRRLIRFCPSSKRLTLLREGTPPFPVKRYALIGFDSVQQAQDWYASPDMKDIQAYINDNTKGRAFAVKAR